MKPKLVVNKGFVFENSSNTLGVEMLAHVANSGLYDVFYHNESINVSRGERGTIVYYNDKKVYVDFWEYMLPTYSRPVYEANFDLIIKLQHYNISPEFFEKACKKKKTLTSITPEERTNFLKKIVPWSFFCSGMIRKFIGKENMLPLVPIERVAFFCGKTWKCRRKMKIKFDKEGIEYIVSDKEPGPDYNKPIKDEEYLHKMMSSKYGLALAGRRSWFSEAKNRREIDYMILKKPLLLNYKPVYYNPLIDGKHYIYFDLNTNIEKIEYQYNINEIAQNAYEWYLENASPAGLCKSFQKIMTDKFG